MRPQPTTVAVELVNGTARVTDLVGGEYLRPHLLGVDGPRAQVALVGALGTLLAGDDLRLHVDVGRDVQLELVEPSGMVAYNGRGGHAGWEARVQVAAGGTLVWRAAPFVIAEGSDVRRHTDIALHRDAVALLREDLVLGRSGEEGGKLRATLRASHAERDLLVEELDLRAPSFRSSPGILGNARVLATVALLGTAAPLAHAEHETALAGPGCLARWLAQHAHETNEILHDTWTRWRDHVERRGILRHSRPAA